MSHEGIRFVDKEHAARETEENRPLPRIAVLGPTKFPEPELVKLHTGVIPHRG